jgi:glycosyltransferase involved in cell wall biosynthesis
MQIQLIFDTFPPEIVGGSIRAYSFCKYLTRFGHEVYVITKKKKGKALVAEDNFPLPKECHVLRNAGLHIPHLPPASGYIPLFLRASLMAAKRYDVDIIHGSSPSIASGIVGYLTKKRTGKPFVFEIRDPWIRNTDIDAKVYSGAYVDPRTSTGRHFKKLEEKICESADKIVVTNPEIMRETLQVHPNIPEDKFHVVYNGADLEDFKGVAPKEFSSFTVFYSGVLYKSRAIDRLLKAMSFTEDVQLLMSGIGPREEMREFMHIINALGLENRVRHLGLIPNQELFSYYLGADAFFAGLDASQANRYLLPSKIFNYMAAGKPIIGTGIKGGGLDRIVTRYSCGKMVYSLSPEEIAETIELFRDRRISRRYGRNGRRAVEREFNRERQTRRLEKVHKSVVE